LWRHNQAGDLPQVDGSIDAVKLGQLVAANTGRRGFTYSHHRDAASIAWIRHANAWGFTVNLSANDLNDADALADHAAGPVVVVCRQRKHKTLLPQRAALWSYARPRSAMMLAVPRVSYASASARPLSGFRPMAHANA
jgi:hypothetical protein